MAPLIKIAVYAGAEYMLLTAFNLCYTSFKSEFTGKLFLWKLLINTLTFGELK
jgi:hypothetical protein